MWILNVKRRYLHRIDMYIINLVEANKVEWPADRSDSTYLGETSPIQQNEKSSTIYQNIIKWLGIPLLPVGTNKMNKNFYYKFSREEIENQKSYWITMCSTI